MTEPSGARNVIFVDGACVLCHGLVAFLLKRDKRKVLSFSTLQGKTAAIVLSEPPYDRLRQEVSSVIYVRDCQGPHERIYTHSTAVLLALRDIGGPWRHVAWLRFLPSPLRNLGYRFIAHNRYRWFGKHDDACPLPSQDDTARFLA